MTGPDGARALAAIIVGGKGGAEDKIAPMREAGIVMAESPADLGEALLKTIG